MDNIQLRIKSEQTKRDMKKIIELTKEEIISFVLNKLPTIDLNEECLECASCGETDKAKYYYICDDCEERLT